MVEEIDVRGLNCPIPVVKTRKALDEIEDGDLTVVIDRPDGCQNVQHFAESQGCTVTIEEKDNLFHIHIHKPKTARSASSEQSSDVVLITTDRLGTGDA